MSENNRQETRSTNGVGETDAPASTTERDGATDDTAILRARLKRLEEENDRLRERYAGVRETRYRRTALGLAAVGVVFGLAGVVVTAVQDVLFAIAAAGLFGAVLTRFLTPEQFIPLDIGEGTYAALADNESALADQLGLSAKRVYLSTPQGPRLFVPELAEYDRTLLEEDAFDRPLVVNDTASRSGAAFRPTAEPLLRAFEEQYRGDLPSTPAEAVATIREGVTDALELAGAVEIDLDSGDGRVTFAVDDPLYGDLTGFDHPISSFLGAGLGRALGVPIEVDVVVTERDQQATALVTCRWDPEALASDADTDGDVDADVDVDADADESGLESKTDPQTDDVAAVDTE
jgi:hypothetical protein